MTTESEIIHWGYNILLSQGYTVKSELPENVKNTPWSYVVRFVTSEGYIYLKHTPQLLALEAGITQILRDRFSLSVPEIIAYNMELSCFLMKDAGRPLREILKQQFDVALLCKGINQFTSIQSAVADHVDIFLNLGVPDWRLDKLPDLFKHLLTKKDLLIADGLSEIEMSELEAQRSKISHLCKKLSDYAIKQTLVQPDFQDNNLLIDDISQNITVIDLGEIVISHPFFSLLGCLQQAKKHHALREEDQMYQQLVEVCFKDYLAVDSKEHLLAVLATARILWLVYGVLSQYRLMSACGREKLMAFQPGRLGGSLKELLTACIAFDQNH